MATKQELRAELESTQKELELYKKAFAAQERGQQPDKTGVYEDRISRFTYELWRLQAAHGGWVKINYGIPQLFYVDDLKEMSETSEILRHIYMRALSARGW